MLTLSLAKCLKATTNDFFRTTDLKQKAPLTYDDLVFLAEYFRVTPLTGIDLSIELTAENVWGLNELSKVIGQNKGLERLRFQIEKSEFHLVPNDNLLLSIVNYSTNRLVSKMNGLVYDAMANMVKDKPVLNTLNINLEAIDTPAHSKQTHKFARGLQRTTLEFLNLNFKVESNAQLPILSSFQTDFNLVDIRLKGLTLGRNILHSIQQTHSLRLFSIDDMHFHPNDMILLGNIFKSNPYLSLVSLTNTNIGQIESPSFIDNLKFCPEVQFLDLSANNLSRLNIDSLCEYIATEPEAMKELNLSHNAYMASDAQKLAKTLVTNKKIESLILDGNYIEDEGLQAIIEMLATNKTITSLSMSRNTRYPLSDATVDALCTLLKNPDCQLEELNFMQTTSLEQFRRLGDAIMANTNLVEVQLDFHTNNILGVMYQIQIKEHLNGFSPLAEQVAKHLVAEEEKPILLSENDTGICIEERIFSDQPLPLQEAEEYTSYSLQLT